MRQHSARIPGAAAFWRAVLAIEELGGGGLSGPGGRSKSSTEDAWPGGARYPLDAGDDIAVTGPYDEYRLGSDAKALLGSALNDVRSPSTVKSVTLEGYTTCSWVPCLMIEVPSFILGQLTVYDLV